MTSNSCALARRPVAACFALFAAMALQGCAVEMRSAGGGKSLVDPCALPLVTCVKVILPPVLVEAGGLQKISITAGQGTGAAALATQLESRLSAVVVDDKPFYRIVKANDPTRQANFEVSTTEWTIADAAESQDRVKCIDKNCKNKSNYKVTCTVRKANVGSLIRLRDVSGAELATRDAGGTASSTQCQGEPGTLEAAAAVYGKAAGKALDTLQDALAVTTAMKQLRLMDDTAQIADAGRKKRFSEAMDFAKAARLDRACPMFEELTEIETASVAVFYNAGFCAQAGGDWRRAFQLYSKADANATKPMSELKAALEETRAYATQKKKS